MKAAKVGKKVNGPETRIFELAERSDQMGTKYAYFFGSGKADGQGNSSDLLGGKEANLAEMARMGVSVPPGFTIITNACNIYLGNQSYPKELEAKYEVEISKVILL